MTLNQKPTSIVLKIELFARTTAVHISTHPDPRLFCSSLRDEIDREKGRELYESKKKERKVLKERSSL